MNGAFFFRVRGLFTVLSLGVVAGCASAPDLSEFSSRDLMEAACPVGFADAAHPKKVKGSIWTKISSKEMSGQFPATVLVEYPTRLAVEVTNLIGAPQAWMKIENGKTELRFTAENEKEYGKPEARNMLGGLPLELAPRLFAGGVPCPSDSKNKDIRVKQTDTGLEVTELDLRSRDQVRYIYGFTRYAGKPWVNQIEWEKLAKGARRSAKSKVIRVVREEPSSPDGAPTRWSASSEQGEIHVRWKDRSIERPSI
jgi:hypothetical protein